MAKEKAEWESVAARINSIRFVAPRKVGENDVLYGSVTSQDVVSFLEQRRTPYITARLALAWAKQTSSGQSDARAAQRLSYVRLFARYRSATDPRTQIPPAGLLPFRPKRRTRAQVAREQGLMVTESFPFYDVAPWMSVWTPPIM